VRIGLFTNNYLPFRGGVTTSVEGLRRGLEARGHAVWVVAPASDRATPDPQVLRCPAVPAATYPEFAMPIPLSQALRRRIRALELDVFHAHHPFLLGPMARSMARRAGRPLVFTYHTHYEKYAHYVPLTRPIVEALAVRVSTRFAASADSVIAPSQAVRDTLRARGVVTPITVVPTGVNVERFCPGDRQGARRALGVPAGDPLLLYVGRLDREKSVDRIIAAFGRLYGTLSQARLVLVGSGTEAPRLRALAATVPGGERIVFWPARAHAELPLCYRAADLFIFASQTETQGLVLAEAAACGLPVVCVAGPGCDEVVRDGETGVLTKNDAGALADAAIALLLDRRRREAMGTRARQVAVDEFDLRAQVDRTLALYARVNAPSRGLVPCRLGPSSGRA
jgi:glycosyltransferase involved in cell wall biosynthesis